MVRLVFYPVRYFRDVDSYVLGKSVGPPTFDKLPDKINQDLIEQYLRQDFILSLTGSIGG